MKTKELKSPCCDSYIRVYDNSTCRVTLDLSGDVIDTSDCCVDGVDMDTLYCEACGEDLELTIAKDNFSNYTSILKLKNI